MKLAQTIEDVYAAETGLARQLLALSTRHVADPDVYAMGRTLSKRCDLHLGELAPYAQRYGATPREVPVTVGDSADADLLSDLRRLYPIAHEVEITWVILLQGALAIRDTELVDVLRPIQAEAQHRWQWLRTRIKDASPQVLAMG
ncbi:hypothetical protein AB0M47_18700 [Hamadaea sp. NPDC051192]|uniref:hypothetical protein n=1 Tax=Hamadaea sp. NPDC051192 TaxID=3154940 RepID=UPI0034335C76